MTDFYMNNYFALYMTTKSLHFIAIVAWFAGLFYLPRLFVYHTTAGNNKQMNETFKIMERKLLKIIMYPAMFLTILTGIVKKHFFEGWPDATYFILSMHMVAVLVFYQLLLHKYTNDFKNDKNKKSQKYFKIMNEIPTALLFIIVFSMYFQY